MKILFIGNSYTYFNNLPKLLSDLAAENGHIIESYSVTKGGSQLHQYLDRIDEYSEKLDTFLLEHIFDAVFLQEQSLLPAIDEPLFLDGAVRLKKKLGDRVARIILYKTWGRKEGSKNLEEHALTRESMTEALSAAYDRVASVIGAEVSNVGPAFLALSITHPEIDLYNPDLSHPSYEGSCLAAMLHYKTLFGVLPEKTDSLALSPEVADAMLKLIG